MSQAIVKLLKFQTLVIQIIFISGVPSHTWKDVPPLYTSVLLNVIMIK